MDNFYLYIFLIVAVVVAFLIVKKIAGCFLKSILLFVIAAALVAIYFLYFAK